jgi:hypothetical protein
MIKLRQYLLLLTVFFPFTAFSQVEIKKINKDSLSHWERKNMVGFDLNEIAFFNWSAGGVSAVTGLLKGQFTRLYRKDNIKWSNELIVKYGLNKQERVEWRKTEDVLQFTTTYGYRRDSTSRWYHSAKFNFNTQFAPGYAYPNTDLSISKPFSPAYTFLGVGAEYSNPDKKINIYLSPMTVKNTLVLEQRLANQGAFGVRGAIYDEATGAMLVEGENSRTEVGILVTSHFKREIYKNIKLENRLNLYTDYLNHFGNIDVDWQLLLDLVVNEYVKANIGLHMIYDDDIKFKEEVGGEQITRGARLQLKQMLGVGLEYKF